MFSNRRPYYGLKLSIADFFREPVRYLKQSNTQESMSERPYLVDEYPKMHLDLPGFKYKPKKRPGFFGEIASGTPYGGLASISYGEARCQWDILNTGYCIKEPVTITLTADYFWHAEFKFVAQIIEDTVGVTLLQLPGTEALGWDDQDYQLTFPENANGSVTICGFASANVLVSDTFENITAGMPVGIYKFGGQQNPAVLQKSSYGTKGANCGCITIETACDPCVDTTPMTWDYDTSAATVARNNSVGIAILDGLGPYDWSIAGTGFTLGSAQTSGVSNTVIADGAACGTATITVTDQCGGSVTGYVRCTTGHWNLVGNGCVLSGAPDTVIEGPYCAIEMLKVEGKYQQRQTVNTSEGVSGSPDCGNYCDASANCVGGGLGCTDCLTWTCEMRTPWGCVGDATTCGFWYCHHFGYDCDHTYGYCQCNYVLQYSEWVC